MATLPCLSLSTTASETAFARKEGEDKDCNWCWLLHAPGRLPQSHSPQLRRPPFAQAVPTAVGLRCDLTDANPMHFFCGELNIIGVDFGHPESILRVLIHLKNMTKIQAGNSTVHKSETNSFRRRRASFGRYSRDDLLCHGVSGAWIIARRMFFLG